MSTKLQEVRGTKDLFGDQARKFYQIVDIAREVAEIHGFEMFSTPIFEFSEVFSRSLGEVSDIVSKEMYSFKDRNDESLTLRPEFTAGVVRSFISNGMQQNLPCKFFSYGPVFRYERPQKGRQRQFHQLNYEVLGPSGPEADAEIISMADMLLKRLGCRNLRLEINSLGDKESRDSYRKALVHYFSKYKNDLSEDSKIRLEKNPLRILDSKDENDRKLIVDAPKMFGYYTDNAKSFFDRLLELLEVLHIKYEVQPNLVRGLDYYCHTAYEFVTDELGAQGTVLAGGRYDSLVEQMGGNPTAGSGFAAGIERLVEISNFAAKNREYFVVAPVDAESFEECFKITAELRKHDIKTEIWADGNLGKRMKKANGKNVDYMILMGEEERKNACVKLRNMKGGSEEIVQVSALFKYIENIK